MPEVTICPPATSTAHFDHYQFAGYERLTRPVSARYVGARNGENGWESTGIDFSSYDKMSTQTKKQSGGRRIRTPAWAINNRSLQMVITEYLLQRAFCGKHRRASAFQSTVKMKPLDKLRFAEAELRSKIPALEKTIHRLMEEYVELRRTGVVVPNPRKDAPVAPTPARRLAVLESQIETIDTSIIINRAAGQVVAAVVYGYYREGLDSVGVSKNVGLKAPAIRQLLFRLWQVAKQMGFAQEAGYARKHSPVVFQDPDTLEIIEGVRPKRAKAALDNAAAIRKEDDRWSAENLKKFRELNKPAEKKLTHSPDPVALVEGRAEREKYIARYRFAKEFPCPHRGHGQGRALRVERAAAGLCTYCGGTPLPDKKSCSACHAYNAACTARARAKKLVSHNSATVAPVRTV